MGLPLSLAQQPHSLAGHFTFQRFTAQDGALSQAHNGQDNFVETVFLDSRRWLWVGTLGGVAWWDGKHWGNRTFKLSSGIARLLSDVVPVTYIAEGPPGTIWINDFCRWKDGKFEEFSPANNNTILGTSVAQDSSLWVVNKARVRKYDGKAWKTVLSPYAKTLSYKSGGLHGIAIETNGLIWVGATLQDEAYGPWEHAGETWVASTSRKTRTENPASAPLFRFDGKAWRAFGPSDGLRLRTGSAAIPEFDGRGRIIAEADRVYYSRGLDGWHQISMDDVTEGMRWVFGEDRHANRAYLRYWTGERFIDVDAKDERSGEPLDLGVAGRPVEWRRIAQDEGRGCLWLGTSEGLYRIWLAP